MFSVGAMNKPLYTSDTFLLVPKHPMNFNEGDNKYFALRPRLSQPLPEISTFRAFSIRGSHLLPIIYPRLEKSSFLLFFLYILKSHATLNLTRSTLLYHEHTLIKPLCPSLRRNPFSLTKTHPQTCLTSSLWQL